MRDNKKLTPKQKRFVEEYLVDLNATQAAIRAGYSPKNAGKIGHALIEKNRILEEIKKMMGQRSERVEITQDAVLRELAYIGFARVTGVVQVKSGKVFITDTDKLSEKELAAISSIKETRDGGVEIKMHDKTKSLELIGRHLGMFDGNTGNTDALETLRSLLGENRKEAEDDINGNQNVPQTA